MWKVIIRRILLMIPQLFILSILVFFFAKLMPGDPFSGLIGPHTDPHEVEALDGQQVYMTLGGSSISGG